MTSRMIDGDGKPLTIRRGTSPSYVFAVTVEGTGAAKDLTGATEATFAIGLSRGAQARDLTLTLGNGVEHDGTGGTITVSLTSAQTEALPLDNSGRRWAELWVRDSAGRRDLIAADQCLILDTLITTP